MSKKLIILGVLLILTGIILTLNNSFSYFGASNTYTGSITVPEDNYCINNGITNLNDCLLVMENYSTTPEEAKTYIESKGEANTSQIAPTITFQETKTEVSDTENGVISTVNHFTLGKGYTFDSTTGLFTLTDYNDNDLSDEYINYYTCGSTTNTYISCTTMYQIKAYVKEESDIATTYRITNAIKYNYKVLETFDSEIGLYATSDDEGTSYFYRGAVENNYLSFAGFVWRIVRINGNGSIRLIYSGTSTSATGNDTSIGNSLFNNKYFDPAYAGYMYHENFALKDNPTTINYSNISNGEIYYYGENYTFNEDTKKFTLNGNIISGTWENVHEEAINNYPYTCFSKNGNETCDYLFRLVGYLGINNAQVNHITYSSVDYPSLLNNTTDSTIKQKIDTWYTTNIENKKDDNGINYSSYLSDEIFCNDRTFTSGDGFSTSSITTYSPTYRIGSQKKPSLLCGQQADKFTVSSEKGNGALTYPVGLITIDETSFAGGANNLINPEYYLYTGQSYWTMSTYNYYAPHIRMANWHISGNGSLAGYTVTAADYIRPVINLSPDIEISGGDGTKNNPYTVALPND